MNNVEKISYLLYSSRNIVQLETLANNTHLLAMYENLFYKIHSQQS